MEQFRGFPKFPYIGPTNEPMMGFPHRVENIDALPGQVLIWDLADENSIILDGDRNVQTIKDKSGNGNDMVVSSSTARPAYTPSTNQSKGYVTSAASKTLGVFLPNFTSSPITIYCVIKLPSIPSGGTMIISIGTTGGTNGMQRFFTATSTDSMAIYTGISPNYSLFNSQPNRTDSMLVKLVLKDENSFWIECNDEPPGMILDTSGNRALTIINRLLFSSVNGVRVSEVRVFNEEISNWSKVRGEKDQIIKDELIRKHSLTRAVGKPNVIIFGDSHSANVMSGTATLGPYNVRMQTSMNYSMLTQATSGTVVNPLPSAQGGVNNLLDHYNKYNLRKWNDFYIVFNYGTNDSTIRSFATGPTRSEWIAYYKNYIQTFLDVGFTPSKIILVTPPYSTGAYVGTKLSEIQADIQQICTDMGLTLCDWYAAMVTATQDINTVVGGDGIHGDNAIHTTLYNTLTPLIV